MRFTQIFSKTRKEAPAGEEAHNAQLLVRAGFADKLSAGVYTYLPLGMRVLERVAGIIREEMNALGGQEIFMPALQPKENWEQTGRWDTMDDLYKVTDARGRESALGPTHEEVVVPLAKQFISSYRDVPVAVYQIQNKFRMELRAKAGLLRGREFLMKDLYSFHADEDDLNMYYERVKNAYHSIFSRAGIGDRTYFTYASGGSFSKYSHEFQTVTPAGEDTIYICDSCNVAVNDEIIAEQKTCPECDTPISALREERAIEVGNIFKLKTKFSEPVDLSFKDMEGNTKPVQMGCYGIGLGRLMGTVVEVLADEKGLVWPEELAPYRVHLVYILSENPAVKEQADALYDSLRTRGIPVLYDDREASAGSKFADAELIGIPTIAIVSDRAREAGENAIALRARADGTERTEDADAFLAAL